MDILKKIQEMQKDRQWSVYKLSKESGLTQSTLSNMFSRQTIPSIATLQAICDAYGISLGDFFGNQGDDKAFSSLSSDEKDLIETYRQLSQDKKEAVKSLLNISSRK